MKAYLVGQGVSSELPQGELETPILAIVQGQLDGNRCIGGGSRVDSRHDGVCTLALQEAEDAWEEGGSVRQLTR